MVLRTPTEIALSVEDLAYIWNDGEGDEEGGGGVNFILAAQGERKMIFNY